MDLNYLKEELMSKRTFQVYDENLSPIDDIPCPREREIILSYDDLECEDEDEESSKPAAVFKNNIEFYKVKNLIDSWNSVVKQFSTIQTDKLERFGIANLYMIEFIDLVLDLVININFIFKKKDEGKNSETKILLNSFFAISAG